MTFWKASHETVWTPSADSDYVVLGSGSFAFFHPAPRRKEGRDDPPPPKESNPRRVLKKAKAFLTALALAILTGPAIGAKPTVTVYNDYGGEIRHYHLQLNLLQHTHVRIKGMCLSACTMFLGAPDVCVYPDATFGFHAARDDWGHYSAAGTAAMMHFIPPNVRSHVNLAAPTPSTLNYYSGADLIRMGVRSCV